jgi:hypothetical protein
VELVVKTTVQYWVIFTVELDVDSTDNDSIVDESIEKARNKIEQIIDDNVSYDFDEDPQVYDDDGNCLTED